MSDGYIFLALLIGIFHCSEAQYKRVCYFTNWSQYRTGAGQYLPSDIPTQLCTHVIYAFAKLQGNQLATLEANDNQLYQQVTGLKSSNPALKTMLAVGGWTAGSAGFSRMAATQSGRSQFIQSAITYLRSHNFDGLDIDWEYPGARGGGPQDKANLASLLKEMRTAFEQEASSSGKDRLLISVAVPAGKNNIDNGYNVRAVGQSVDFINLMAYDLHGSWDGKTGENAPLHAKASDSGDNKMLTVEYAANYWAQQGAPKDKIIVGMPTYGQTFRVSGGPDTPVGAPSSGPGAAGPVTQQAGFLAYHEICKMMESGGKDHWESEQHVPYYVNGQTWVGYDNVRSITEKSLWVKQNKFGGGMIWALDSDDFNKVCASSSRPYPLLSAINAILGGASPVPTTPRPTQATTQGPIVAGSTTTVNQGAWTTTKSWTDGQTTGGSITPWTAWTAWTSGQTWKTWWTTTLSNWQQSHQTTTQQVWTPAPTDPTQPWQQQTTTQIVWTPAPTNPPAWQTTKPPSAVVTHHASSQFSCQGLSDGFHKDPSSCTVFYRCMGGNAVHFSCTTGTQYNPQLHECDWPYNVNCTPGK